MNSLPLSTLLVFGQPIVPQTRASVFRISALIADARIGRRAEPGMCIDDGQNAELLFQGRLVVNEIPPAHAMHMLSGKISPRRRSAQWTPDCRLMLCLLPALRVLVPKLQAQLVVNPAGLLGIDLPTKELLWKTPAKIEDVSGGHIRAEQGSVNKWFDLKRLARNYHVALRWDDRDPPCLR